MSPLRGGVLVVAPVLPPDVRMMAAALERSGRLQLLSTRACFARRPRASLLFPSLARRPTAPVAAARLQSVPWADMVERLGRLAGRGRIPSLDASFAVVDAAAARLISPETGAVLAREDACRESFARAAELGHPCVYQLPTAHFATVEKLMRRELQLWPEAVDSGEVEADFAPERLSRKAAELEPATHVLCPSTFVADTVRAAGVSVERITTITLGADTLLPTREPLATRAPVFLYAGQVSARKGVHRLLAAWKRLGAYRTHRLRLIGELRLPKRFLAEHRRYFEHVPWLARERLALEYIRARAFVFNAMADGFGHVFAEAMVCGTPVLASRNSGAPDLVTDAVEGKLFEYADDEQLASALDWALSHPGQLRQMGAAARQRALAWGWPQFEDTFGSWVEGILGGLPAPLESGVGREPQTQTPHVL